MFIISNVSEMRRTYVPLRRKRNLDNEEQGRIDKARDRERGQERLESGSTYEMLSTPRGTTATPSQSSGQLRMSSAEILVI